MLKKRLQKLLLSGFIFFGMIVSLRAIDDYQITVNLDNYDQKQLILAHYLGKSIFADDTASISPKGNFIFEAKKDLVPGIYLLVIPPDNKYVEILLTEQERKYQVFVDALNLEKVTFESAPDNELYHDYLQLTREIRPQIDSLSKRAAEQEKTEELQLKINELQQQLTDRRTAIIQQHPDKLSSTILKSYQRLEIPEFSGTEEEIQRQQFLYRHQHFFDYVKDDPRFFRSKLCYEMIDFYLKELTIPQPDSTLKSVETVLNMLEPDTLAFRSYFVEFINRYLNSPYMGMEAVYVHLVKNYTMQGKTPYFSEETHTKLIKNALVWEKTLLGRTAPNLNNYHLKIEESIKRKDHENENRRFAMGEPAELYDIEKPYTVLVFWAPDCGHCEKSMPYIVDFYEKNKEQVEVFAICHTNFQQFGDCAAKLKAYNAIRWMNTIDPYYKYLKNYDPQKTPLILVLDDQKKVVFKNIAAEKLQMAMEQLLQEKNADQKP